MAARPKEGFRLTGLIKQSRLESAGVYGYHEIVNDLCELGESCSKNAPICPVPSNCAHGRVLAGTLVRLAVIDRIMSSRSRTASGVCN